ncbi:hypothetical protein BCR44DRAFT_27979 [Catenaria anguillulae PL171]|uniref:Uncharacterized protein n=1 Tax=Catenaria anguillulae PL171 TaxID=765915 RepID=A0A1Y2H5V5_9FUNG|nr:hypothetical protein BCR44DRAFT_27979 [Catenaria anguillulae PL171]
MSPTHSYELAVYPDMAKYFRRSPRGDDVFEALAAWDPDVIIVKGEKYSVKDMDVAVEAAEALDESIHIIEKVPNDSDPAPSPPSSHLSYSLHISRSSSSSLLSSSQKPPASSKSSNSTQSRERSAAPTASKSQMTVVRRHPTKASEMPEDLYGRAPTVKQRLSHPENLDRLVEVWAEVYPGEQVNPAHTIAVDEFFSLASKLVSASSEVSRALETTSAYHHLHDLVFRAVETSMRMLKCDGCHELLAYPLYAHDDCHLHLCSTCLLVKPTKSMTRCRDNCTAGLSAYPGNQDSWGESLATLHFRPYMAYLQSLDPEDAQRVWERLLPMDNGGTGFLRVDEVGHFEDFVASVAENEETFKSWQTPAPTRSLSRRSGNIGGLTSGRVNGGRVQEISGGAVLGALGGKQNGMSVEGTQSLESYLLSSDDESAKEQGGGKSAEEEEIEFPNKEAGGD